MFHMINRISKIESLEAVGTWTLATRGEKQSKKNFKRDIKSEDVPSKNEWQSL